MERLTGARPPRQRRAFSTLGGPVEVGGDAAEGAALAALFEVKAELARALTHGFHSYAGRMHPSMARGALERWSRRGARVLDPFCGSGTVLVEAFAGGCAAAGRDSSPLAVLIAQVRTTPLGAEGRLRLVREAAAIAEASADRARRRLKPAIPAWARREHQRFAPHVALELLGLRELVMAAPEDDVGRALRLCLSSLLVKFMRAGPEAPRDAAGKRIGRGVPSRFFAGRAAELARGLEALERAAPAGTPRPRVALGDARAYPDLPDGSADLIVTSPPYAGTYDYVEHHDVRFAWLGLPLERAERSQLGGRARGLGAAPREWREGRRRWLGEMGRVLARGAHAVLVVGDGVVGDQPEDAADAIAAEAPGAQLEPVARASQLRATRDKRLLEIFAGHPRREHLLLLRRR